MVKNETKSRSLSKLESNLILEMEWRNQRVIDLNEIQVLLGISKEYSRLIAYRLVHKKWLERLRYGIFQLIPATRGLGAVPNLNNFLDNKVFDTDCFYSMGSACSYYGFTEQAFAEMYLISKKNHKSLKIRGTKYIFTPVSKYYFFGYHEVTVLGQKVQMATQERAILDALDRPRYAGGITEVSRIIKKGIPQIDFNHLLELLLLWKQSSLVQRLGFFIDLHKINVPASFRQQLKQLIRPKNKIHLATRGRWKITPRFNSEWMIIENIPMNLLIDKKIIKKQYIFRGSLKKGNKKSD